MKIFLRSLLFIFLLLISNSLFSQISLPTFQATHNNSAVVVPPEDPNDLICSNINKQDHFQMNEFILCQSYLIEFLCFCANDLVFELRVFPNDFAAWILAMMTLCQIQATFSIFLAGTRPKIYKQSLNTSEVRPKE